MSTCRQSRRKKQFLQQVYLASIQHKINISCASMFFPSLVFFSLSPSTQHLSLPCLFLSVSKHTTPPREWVEKWRICLWNSSTSYWMVSLSLFQAWKHLSPKSTVWRWQLSPDKHQCVWICVHALCVCVCVLQENGICYGCLPGLGEFGAGGGGCSWGLCGGPLSRGATGA